MIISTRNHAEIENRTHVDYKPLNPEIPEASLQAQPAPQGLGLVRFLERRITRVYVVQSISCLRLLGALIFACLVFRDISRTVISCIYACAIISDVVDGYLSRRLQVVTYFGKVLDLVADKSLTVVSLLYAAACGVDVIPLAVIATRDLMMVGMRLVIVEGVQLFPTSRTFGGLMAALLWGNTLFLIHAREAGLMMLANFIYWICAILSGVNFFGRIYKNKERIKTASIR